MPIQDLDRSGKRTEPEVRPDWLARHLLAPTSTQSVNIYASFTYIARESGSGREIRNSLDAISEQAAIASLLNRNLLVVSIQEKVGKKGKTSGGSVALADLVVFTRQLATMIDAGLAMVQSLAGSC